MYSNAIRWDSFPPNSPRILERQIQIFGIVLEGKRVIAKLLFHISVFCIFYRKCFVIVYLINDAQSFKESLLLSMAASAVCKHAV